MIPSNSMIVAKGHYYSMDCYQTGVNNNVLVVGSSGSGKTRGIVEPNILQATGSYIISDPKGTLYPKYKNYLKKEGYEVKVLDFIHPEQSCHYNFFEYIRSTRDVIKMANILIYGMGESSHQEPFWEQSAELLLSSLIAYLWLYAPQEEQTLAVLQELLINCEVDEEDSSFKTVLDILMERKEAEEPGNFASRQYKKFRIAAGKTLKSILITLNSKLGKYDFEELNQMLAYDDIDIASIGQKKTAVFVIVSDTDRSMDGMANVFFSQAMNELCRYADEECAGRRLPIDVRFILDDFATNCRITGFPSMISNIRARGISAMCMLQAEAQLEAGYGTDAKTIMANCDTYVYMGGNDVATAKEVAVRCDQPYRKVLNMPVGTNWIFRRGKEPVNGVNFPLEEYWAIKENRSPS